MAGESSSLRKVEDVFHAVADLPPEERNAAVTRLCGGDAALAAEVRDLLRVFDTSPDAPDAADDVDGSHDAPERFGAYEIERELGRGGQGVVFLARDTRLNRQVALKVMTGFAARSPSLRARMQREAEVASRIDHAAVCTVYEAGVEDGMPFIGMRYVAGVPLSQRIRATDGAPTSARIRDYVTTIERVARGLHEAHEAGLVHRDVKPGNIMVTPDGDPVLLDFGIARELETDHTLTESETTMGTPAYMAPEQIADAAVDRRADVYSLAVTLYECVAGRRPFDAPTRERLYLAITRDPAPSARRFNPQVPADLDAVLSVSLEKAPDRRYQTAADFADDLAAVLAHRPIAARPAGPMLRAVRFAERNPVVAGLLVAIVLIVAGAIGWLSLKNRDLRDSLEREQDARRAAKTSLDAYQRLADGERVRDYEAEAAKLPAWRASDEAGLVEWIGKAEALTERLPVHRARMERLLARAVPGDPEDRERHPKTKDVIKLQGRVDRIDEFLHRVKRAGFPKSAQARFERAKADRVKTVAAIDKLEAEIAADRKPHFERREDQWEHDTLRDIIRRLNRFVQGEASDSALARTRARLAYVRGIAAQKEADRAAWAAAIRSIGDEESCPRYAGLRIESVDGLVPIRRDPTSGLWEFAHRQTGAVPAIGDDGRYRINGETGLVFVLLPGGDTRVGAERPKDDRPPGPHRDRGAFENETPTRSLTLRPFFLSKYEMTQAQWTRFAGANPSVPWTRLDEASRRELPVQNVSWYLARDVLAQMGLALPTEAQWEYAYRAGTTTRWPTGDDPATLRGFANLRDKLARGIARLEGETVDYEDGHAFHAAVGVYRPNALGLHDMAGNVWEWCRDNIYAYDNARITLTPDGETRKNGRSYLAAIRGGGCADLPTTMRSSARASADRGSHDNLLGVRPALMLPTAEAPAAR